MANTAFGKLNQKQKRCVALYTDESKSGTYLNRIESYAACYKTNNRSSIRSAAMRFFKKQEVREAIKELLPTTAYDTLFIRQEYLHHYEAAKKAGDRRDCLVILKEMATHEGMLQKKQDTKEESQDRKDLNELKDKIAENFKLRSQEMKERLNGTDQ